MEGDSASLAELCALLSDLSAIPLSQALGITGAVNQLGDVQAIGGVNEKIEGFFEVCAARGLTGRQAVIIPASNVQHLMLREPVVTACQEERFAVYPITRVDEALSLLTGLPADAVHEKVEFRLREFANVVAQMGGRDDAAAAEKALAAAPPIVPPGAPPGEPPEAPPREPPRRSGQRAGR